MSQRRFYMLALSARQLSGVRVAFDPATSVRFFHQDSLTSLSCGWVVAESDEQARGLGIGLARAEWPPADGWADHSAAICVFERADLEEVTRQIEGEDVHDEEFPEFLP